jgi:N-acetylmuramoyl-L-alanine amidase
MIVLDPGHGGNDRGTVGPGGLEEKRLTLDISRRVASRLSRCGFVVRLTRDRDRTVLLDERTRIAAGLRADVLISVHINSSPDFRVRGFETFVTASPGFPSTASSRRRRSDDVVHLNNRFDAQNVVLGYDVQRGLLCYAEGQDRGLKRARFQILRDARCPAALVECGFASNKTDRENLLSAAYRDTVADGIARGLMTYAVDVRRAP